MNQRIYHRALATSCVANAKYHIRLIHLIKQSLKCNLKRLHYIFEGALHLLYALSVEYLLIFLSHFFDFLGTDLHVITFLLQINIFDLLLHCLSDE